VTNFIQTYLFHHIAERRVLPNERGRRLTQEPYMAQTSLASSAPLQREGTTLMATSLESSMDERIHTTAAHPHICNPAKTLNVRVLLHAGD
jgi:hypothetical protein